MIPRGRVDWTTDADQICGRPARGGRGQAAANAERARVALLARAALLAGEQGHGSFGDLGRRDGVRFELILPHAVPRQSARGVGAPAEKDEQAQTRYDGCIGEATAKTGEHDGLHLVGAPTLTSVGAARSEPR